MSEQHTTVESARRTHARHGRRSRRKKKNRLPVLIILLLIFLAAAAFAATILINHMMPTKEQADLEALYGAGDGYASVIANHEWIDSKAVWQNDHAYLDYKVLVDELGGRFFWDSENHTFLYTLPEETMVIDASEEYDGAPVFIEQDSTVYLSLSYAEQYMNITVETFTDPARVVLQTEWSEIQTAGLKKDAAVRVRGGIKSEVITNLKAGEIVTVLETLDNWSEVQTPDGWIGYIRNSDLEDALATVTEEAPDNEPEYSSLSVDYDVCLMWEQSVNSACTSQLKELISSDAMNSVTTVGPTWFSIEAADGTISSRASADYVSLAHENNLDVWPVLENVNNTEVDMTSLLMSTSARTALISSVMAALEESGADGLNVDLENIPTEASEGYIQLIRELSVECRKKGLILSVDDVVPSAWSGYYNRKEQGIVADYVIVMAYDEHYNGSEEIGSTASLSYVQQAVIDTCAEVPTEKVICGVPFYSRLWKEELTSTTSETIGMDGMQEFIAKYNAEPTWDSDLGQNYVKVENGDVTYELWVEDAESMEARLNMLSAYDLAGIACWKQGMQSADIWSVLAAYHSR